jgi:O-antigen ligase
MFVDHPWFGVGLDNFLYAYRGRYIFDAAWQEPNLNHPHNILLDFATRLGLLGVLAGGWLFWEYGHRWQRLWGRATAAQLPLVVGIGGMLADIIGHGLVDHSFFLVDLAFVFYLGLGTAVWLTESSAQN